MVPIYCCHHLPATDRRDYLRSRFDTESWHWITDYLPTDEMIARHPTVLSEHAANGRGFLNAAELSLYHKHRLAIELIEQSQEYSLIVEDDIEAPDFDVQDVAAMFVRAMREAEIDLVFVGSYAGSDISASQPTLVCNDHTLSRCTHAYLVRPTCASRILEHLSTVRAPIDWQLNFAIRELRLRCCWSWPHIYQRSERGRLASLIRTC